MIEVTLLGHTSVRGAVRLTAADMGGVKPRQLLALLALDLGRPVPKDVLADRLWDQRPPNGCITTLESYVCLLRRKLRVSAGRHCAIATSHGGYLLDPDQARVDLHDVTRLLAGNEASVLRGLDRIPGDLLADEPYATWAEEARTTFADVLATACTRAAGDANRAGRHAPAVRLARAATRSATFSEPALRELMRALVGVGDRTAALNAYEDMRARLAAELGLDLDAETRALFLGTIQQDRASERVCDRAEASALVRLLRTSLDNNPAVLVGIPGSIELIRALQALSPTG
ncbi:AfsR/SARP family transcriptional regulator [Nocardioides sp. P5_C9_2]